jgi:hypothetical protein
MTLGCVDKADFETVTPELPLIIEGSVTDDPGPDTVKITKAYPADGGYYSRVGITGATVRITSDVGESDVLTDIGRGCYVTNTLQGATGRTYQLFVTIGGHQYRSSLQRMLPPGQIDDITFEFTSKVNSSTGLTEDGFNVFVNSTVGSSSSHRLRYKVLGTYKVTTNPELIQIRTDCASPPCPTQSLPCATNCECCVCWVSERENSPKLLNPEFVGGNTITRIPVHYIPINNYTFNERYRVEVSQMELSQDAYDFYAAVRKQIENASSIFQPPFFELKGNVEPINQGPGVVGIFSAAAITKRYIYIYRSDVPYDMVSEAIAADCRAVAPNSSNQIPPFWN